MKFAIFTLFLACVAMSAAFPYPQEAPQERQGGGYGKQPDGYFQYVNVPAHKEYEFGWNRGNPHHYISRYEQSKDHRFRTRVRWGDKKGGYGEHYYEYNHGPSHKGGYAKEDVHEPVYSPPASPPKYGPV